MPASVYASARAAEQVDVLDWLRGSLLPNAGAPMKLPNLRELARGQDCKVWLPGCLYGPETVVLAHLRIGGTAGVGQKPPDLCGVYACANCHDVLDGRKFIANLTKAEIEQAALRALCRTLAIVTRAAA